MSKISSSGYDARARPKPLAFYPPKTNPFVVRLVQLGIKRELRRTLRVEHVEISDADLDLLRQMKSERCLLTPSHSGGFEPHVVMYLSKLLGACFNYVAAVELFEQAPLHRWLMPRLGVYSVVRGAADRPSLSMTRKLLSAGKRWLVIFPEGQSIWQNSTLVPFQRGVFQLAYKALEDARDADEKAHLYCLPMAIKYVYVNDMHESIDQSLGRLEDGLAIVGPEPGATRYSRLRRIGETMLAAIEKAHHIKPAADASMNDRIQAIKELVISRMEEQLGVTPAKGQTLLDRLRTLFNVVDRSAQDVPQASVYERQLALERQQTARTLYEDLWRLLQFVAIYDGYVRESMTVERFMDVLCLLEMEVFRERRIWGPRIAKVKVGRPIDLRERYSSYLSNKREEVRQTTLDVESSVREMLDSLATGCARVRETG